MTIQTYPIINGISAITNSFPSVYTLILPVNYKVDELISIRCPQEYGMVQVNGLTGRVLSVDSIFNTITLDIDTSGFDPFVFVGPFTQLAQTIPAGEIGTLEAATRNNTPRAGYVPA